MSVLLAALAAIAAAAGLADLLGTRTRRRGRALKLIARLGASLGINPAGGLAARIAAAGLDRPTSEIVALQAGLALVGTLAALPLATRGSRPPRRGAAPRRPRHRASSPPSTRSGAARARERRDGGRAARTCSTCCGSRSPRASHRGGRSPRSDGATPVCSAQRAPARRRPRRDWGSRPAGARRDLEQRCPADRDRAAGRRAQTSRAPRRPTRRRARRPGAPRRARSGPRGAPSRPRRPRRRSSWWLRCCSSRPYCCWWQPHWSKRSRRAEPNSSHIVPHRDRGGPSEPQARVQIAALHPRRAGTASNCTKPSHFGTSRKCATFRA